MMGQAASIPALRERARRRLPRFVYQYLSGGCISDSTVRANREALDRIRLIPRYLPPAKPAALTCQLLGQNYNLPLGIAPIGLGGLIWPRSAEYLAEAAKQSNIPFVLSTVATTPLETAARLAGENFWFQLYPPPDQDMRRDLMRRALEAGCRHLVVTIDVPALGRRPRDLENGIGIPPRYSASTLLQCLLSPAWGLATLASGRPEFGTLKDYLGQRSGLAEVSDFVRKSLKDVVDTEVLSRIRDEWPHRLVVKGIITAEDAGIAIQCGADAIWVSNHGGRQLDGAFASAEAVGSIVRATDSRVPVLVDSGVESGVDIARFLGLGADMVFAGRAFMYGVAAEGRQGAANAVHILGEELAQTLAQLRCSDTADMDRFIEQLHCGATPEKA